MQAGFRGEGPTDGKRWVTIIIKLSIEIYIKMHPTIYDLHPNFILFWSSFMQKNYIQNISLILIVLGTQGNWEKIFGIILKWMMWIIWDRY